MSVTLGEAIFEERRVSLQQALDAMVERITSNDVIQRNLQLRLPVDDIVPIIERIVKRSLRSEQEIFLSYLMFNVIQVHRDTGAALPEFAKEFRRHYGQLDPKYDPNGKLRQLLLTFRERPCPNVVSKFENFMAEYLGFYFDASKMRALLLNLRTLFFGFATDMVRFMQEVRDECIDAVSNLKQEQKSPEVARMRASIVSNDKRMLTIERYADKLAKIVRDDERASAIVAALKDAIHVEIVSEVDESKEDLVSKNMELAQTIGKLQRENKKLRKAANLMKDQMIKGNSDFGNLYSNLETLHSSLKARVSEIDAADPDSASAVVMKARLLLEEATVAKMSATEKENALVTIRKELNAAKRQLAYLTESEKLYKEKYALIKSNAKAMLAEKGNMEDMIARQNELITKLKVKLQTKTASSSLNDRKVAEHEDMIEALQEKITKVKQSRQNLKMKCEEQEDQISTLSLKVKDLAESTKRAEVELSELREQNKFLKNCQQERDVSELKYHQVSLENEDLQHRLAMSEREIDQLKQTNNELSESVSENHRQTLTVQREMDVHKSNIEKEKAQLVSENRQLVLEKEELKQRIAQLKESKNKSDRLVETLKMELERQNESVSEQLKEMSTSSQKRFTALESAHEVQKKEMLQQIELSQKSLSDAHKKHLAATAENSKLKMEVDESKSQWKQLMTELQKLFPGLTKESMIEKIRALQREVKRTQAFMDSIDEIVSIARIRYSEFFDGQNNKDLLAVLTDFTDVFEKMQNKIERVAHQKSQLENQIHEVLVDAHVKRLEDIPDAIADLQQQLSQKSAQLTRASSDRVAAVERLAAIVKDISKLFPYSMEDSLAQDIAQMKSNFEKLKKANDQLSTQYSNLLESLKTVVSFTRPAELAPALQKLRDERKADSQNLNKLTSQVETLTSELTAASAKLDIIQSALPDTDIKSLPRIISKMKSSIERLTTQLDTTTTKHKEFLKKLSAICGSWETDEASVLKCVSDLSQNARHLQSELHALQSRPVP